MKKDVTSFTRYFAILIAVFVVWLFMIHDLKKEPVFRELFGMETKSL
jgi:hypothetical protein